jgi:outer membrane protein OmpA-like peptidoglycan-associated protein
LFSRQISPWGPAAAQDQGQKAAGLKDHPGVRIYIEGYASTRGEDIIYNLVLSAKRAETVRRTLVGMGIPENRIVITTGRGQLYPVCPEKNDACWSKNRRVIFRYVPSSQGSGN